MKQDRDLEVDTEQKKNKWATWANQKAQVSNFDQDTQLSSVSL